MSDEPDDFLVDGDQIRIMDNKEPEDPLFKFVGAGVQVDFQDRDLLQCFLEFLTAVGARVEVNNKNILFYWKELSDGSDDRGISDSGDGRESESPEGD